MREQTQLFPKPPRETMDAVYSNLFHEFHPEVVAELEIQPGEICAQHSAWHFCGYVWQLSDGRWVDQVWQWNSPVSDIVGDDAMQVIELANDEFGYD